MEEAHTFAQELSDILEKNKVVSKEEAQAMQIAFKDSEQAQFDDFLIEEGLVDQEDLLKALSQYYQVPSFDVGGYFFDHFLITKFPKGFLLREAVIPVGVEENILSVVANNPSKEGLESAMREFVTYDITFMVGLRLPITDAVKEFYDKAPTQVKQDIDLREERRLEAEAEEIEDSSELAVKLEEED